MNLIESPWIPVSKGGGIALTGLREVFQAGSRGQLRCPTPTEDLSVLRVLIAVATAALQPQTPQDVDGWLGRQEAAAGKITEYLQKWHGRFELFSEEAPFMQIGGMTQDKKTSVNVLLMERATGNTPALFDHSRDDCPQGLSPAEAARALIAHQSFSVALGKTPSVTINGQTLLRGSRKDGCCTRGMHVYLTGETVLETVLLNMVAKPTGTPGWEDAEPYWKADGISQIEPVPFDGICDRYTMISRLIRLLPDEDGKVRWMYYSMGRSIAEGQDRDPMQVHYQDARSKNVFRQAAPLAGMSWSYLLRIMEKGGCDVIDQARQLKRLPKSLGLQMVGVRSEIGKATKMIGWTRDWLPASRLLQDSDFEETTLAAIEEGTQGALALRGSKREAYWARLRPKFYQCLAVGTFGDTWKQEIESAININKKYLGE